MVRNATIAALAAVLLAASPARAQRADGGQEVERQRALDLLDESAALYREGRFAEAAERLRRAHALHPEPSLLYNLGRALEAMGDAEGAADAYARYLEADPESPRRGEVSARLERLRRELPPENGVQGPVEEGEGGAAGGELGGDEGEREQAGPSIAGPVIVAGAGAIALGTGAAIGLLALSRQSDADGAADHRELARLDAQAHDLATAANVLFVIGGVAAAVGVAWLVLELGDDDAELGLGPGFVRVRGHF